jgi:hypothetical protein
MNTDKKICLIRVHLCSSVFICGCKLLLFPHRLSADPPWMKNNYQTAVSKNAISFFFLGRLAEAIQGWQAREISRRAWIAR